MEELKMAQIVLKNEFVEIRKRLKSKGKTIVLCHGVFDLVHPGHIIHFEEAKKLGDILVVSITASKFVRKGPGRPYFDDIMRQKFLSAIDCIDYVMLSESYTVDDIIEVVEPDIYAKGQEYAKAEDDITGKITEEVALVQSYGGTVIYTKGLVFSSTKLINHALPSLSSEVKSYLKNFCQICSLSDIKKYVENMKDQKVLVIGDIIIDEYIFSSVQGLMSKDMGYSVKYKYSEQYLGGSLAVARHLSSFSDHVTIMGIVGPEKAIHSRLLNELGNRMRMDFVYSSQCDTILKKRYVSLNEKREEINKIFAVNNLPDPMTLDQASLEQFYQNLHAKVDQYDIVILCDFGHGLIDHKAREIIQDKAKFLALNCQTNSSNYGKNLITKYYRADVFALDQRELSLAFSDYQSEESEALKKLEKHFGKGGWLTRGAKGAIAVRDGKLMSCPAFTLKVKDTIGAGDAFFALASLAVSVGASEEIGMFMGNIAGALAANIVGNKESIEKVNVLKYANTLLNI